MPSIAKAAALIIIIGGFFLILSLLATGTQGLHPLKIFQNKKLLGEYAAPETGVSQTPTTSAPALETQSTTHIQTIQLPPEKPAPAQPAP